MARRLRLRVVDEAKPYVAPAKQKFSGEAFLAQLMADADYKIKYAKVNLEKFKKNFEDDPLLAFEWSKDAFVEAARLRVAQMVLKYVEMLRSQADEYERKTDLQIVHLICEEFEREVLRKARWPERSTSPQHNEVALCLNAEMAEWLSKVKEKFQYLEVY